MPPLPMMSLTPVAAIKAGIEKGAIAEIPRELAAIGEVFVETVASGPDAAVHAHGLAGRERAHRFFGEGII